MRWRHFVLCLSLSVAWPLGARAAESALDIAKKTEANYRGFGGLRVNLRMALKDESGAEKVYELTELEMDHPEHGLRMLIRFKSPAAIAGSALLTREVKGADDEMWLYLAGTKQLKRISGSDRTSTFLGSEIDFEQLTFPKVVDFHHALQGEEKVADRPCWLIEQTPKVPSPSYGKVTVCVDKERFVPLETKYFDPAGKLHKVLSTSDYRQYGTKWRPHRMEIKNVVNGRVTSIEAKDYKIGVELSEKLFTVSQLRTQ